MIVFCFFCGGGGGLVIGGGALLVGGGSVCDDLGIISTCDEVMLTLHPELAHCATPPPLEKVQTEEDFFTDGFPYFNKVMLHEKK